MREVVVIDTPTPKPGELWDTDRVGGVAVKTEDGWRWPSGGSLLGEVNPCGDGPVGYTAEYVDRLQIGDALIRDFRATIRDLHDRNRLLAEKRDEAIARAEAAKGALAVHLADDTNDFQTVVDDEPWRVLLAASDVVVRRGHDPNVVMTVMGIADHLTGEADRLEREHGETAKRDRLIEKATVAFKDALNITTANPVGIAAVVDAVLAEAGESNG